MLVLAALSLALAAGSSPAAMGAEAVLLDEQAFGVVPIEDDFDRVVVSKLKGTLVIQRSEKPHEVQFSSYSADPRREPLPVALWSEGKTLRFEPTANARAQAYALDIFVCDGMDVTLDLDGTQVTVAGLPKGLEVRGTGLTLKAVGVGGKATFDLVGGTAILGGVAKRLEVRGRDLDLSITDTQGAVALRLAGGKARVSGVNGDFEADTQGTMVAIESSVGLSVKAARGRVDLVDSGDVELALSGAPVSLTRVRGRVRIETDADVKLTESTAAIHIDASGGAVRGSGNSGDIEIKARNAEISLEHTTGPLHVEGESLRVRLLDLVSESEVTVQRSDVDSVGNQRFLSIDSREGNVNVRSSIGRAVVRATGGTVALIDLRASVELHAEVTDVLVSFAILPSDDDSVLENTGGGIQLHVPDAGSSRVEARSKSGRIESDLEDVVVDPEGTTATGLVGGAGGRTINVQASWDIRLTGQPVSGPPR